MSINRRDHSRISPKEKPNLDLNDKNNQSYGSPLYGSFLPFFFLLSFFLSFIFFFLFLSLFFLVASSGDRTTGRGRCPTYVADIRPLSKFLLLQMFIGIVMDFNI